MTESVHPDRPSDSVVSAESRSPREAAIIAAAKVEHDEMCSCDPRYLMSCGRMAQAILAQGRKQ